LGLPKNNIINLKKVYFMEKKKIKTINFNLTLDGYGCVNSDSTEQVHFLLNTGIVNRNDSGFVKNNKPLSNVILTKKNFRQTKDGKYEYHIKISSECLKNNIFRNTMKFVNPSIVTIPRAFYQALANPDMIARGYMFPKKGNVTVKKKSVLCITDAEELGDWRKYINMDFHSRSGMKESNDGKNSEDAKDTSIYKIENVGSIKYMANGAIDVSELRFIPADPIYERLSVDVDGGQYEEIYMKELIKNSVNFTPEFKYYYLENSYTADEFAERGIMLNDETLDAYIKRIIKNMLNIDIMKRNAYLKTDKLTLTISYTNGEQDVIDVTLDMLDNLTFDCVNPYKEADMEKILANKKMMETIKK
jgi:hypothetical protein